MSKMKKMIYFIGLIIILSSLVYARDWTPFGDINMQDYFRMYSVTNVSAILFMGNISCHQIFNGSDTDYCDDAIGGGGVGMWQDNGTFISPNESYASNVAVYGYINATDWSNVSITESQISDLSHTTDTNETTRVDALYSNISVFLYDSNETDRVDALYSNISVFLLDTNETDYILNLSATNCTGTDKVIGVYSNGSVVCIADLTAASNDTFWNITGSIYLYNASGILDINETKLNATIDDRDSDTTYTAEELYIYLDGTTFRLNVTELNLTMNASIDARVTQSFLELLGFNITTDLKTYFDTLYSDTNETSRVDALYSNISVFLLDTNVTTACSDDEVLLGNGSCSNSSLFGQAYTAGFLLYLSGTQFNVNSTELNTTMNASIDARVTQSFLELLGFNITTDLKDYFDSLYASISVVDTNETTRVDALYTNISVFLADTNETTRVDALYTNISVFLYDSNETSRVDDLYSNISVFLLDTNETDFVLNLSSANCTGTDKAIGVYSNGTVVCDTDTTIGNCSVDESCDTIAYLSNTSYTLDSELVTVLTDYWNWTSGLLNYTNLTTCADNEIIKMNGASWNCEADADTGGTGSNYAPSTINLTSGTHNASLVNGSDIGYNAGNSICDAEFSGSHFCTEFEVTLWFGNQTSPNLDDDAWIIAGSPKYIPADVPVNDCNGFTHGTAGTYLGNYWHFNSTTGGDGRALNCATTLKLACCSY